MKLHLNLNCAEMYKKSIILLFAASFVCSTIAITLPNGFVFDEKLYIKPDARATLPIDICDRKSRSSCSEDCSTELSCDENKTLTQSQPCSASCPYCVRGSFKYNMCTKAYSMSNPKCVAKALANFVCTADGRFPDPFDCTKYHICNGTAHSIVECPTNYKYTIDPSVLDLEQGNTPANPEFACRFAADYYCDEFRYVPNGIGFRTSSADRYFYIYSLEAGTMRQTMVFRCPMGTYHNYTLTSSKTDAQCTPIGAQSG